MSLSGTVLKGRYELVTEIGKGGMSTVYLSKDKSLECYWAVKQIKNTNSMELEAFKKEVELLASLSHPDIPRIVDRIEQEDDYFVVMDFVDGASLGKMVMADGPQPEEKIIDWAKQLCDVLGYLHKSRENPIVYRDMKPENVMITQSNSVKLIDFGIAKEFKRGEPQTGAAVGTKGYAAPEQYQGASNLLDERTDIYSLGATLFYLSTGVPPGKPPKAISPIRQINQSLSEGLEYIISKCTKDNPQERYQTCAEIKEDLENIHILNSAYRNQMARRLLPFAISAGLMILFFITGVIGFAGVKADQENTYQYYYQKAFEATQEADQNKAVHHYMKAISHQPGTFDTYPLLFHSMLPEPGAKDYITAKEKAIDTMRNKYLNNTNSPMYKNEDFMYFLGKQCLEVQDPAYAAYALDYFNYLKKRKYKSEDIGAFQLVASNSAKNIATQDFKAFNKALLRLEKATDTSVMDINTQLENYFTIMTIYSSYPTQLRDAYNQIYEIGEKARKIIQKNINTKIFKFNHIIDLYEMVASSCYYNGLVSTNDEIKQENFRKSLTWFEYLEDMNVELSERSWLNKANASKGIFDLYNTQAKRKKIKSAVKTDLETAIQQYKQILEQYPESFLAAAYITQAYMDQEMIKPSAGARNYSKARAYYQQLAKMKANDNQLTDVELLQFSSVKQQMHNAGLEK